MFFVFKLAAVFLSLFGYMTFANDRLKLHPAFTPLFSVSTSVLVIYVFGLVGLLQYGALLIFATGIVLLTCEMWRTFRKKYSAAEFFSSSAVIVFTALSIFCIVKMKDMLLLHPDNFSHWAVILKEMCYTDAFPVEGTAVYFRNYPPGSACFAYLFCHIAGYTEGVGLIAHGVIISASLSAVFCKVKRFSKAAIPLCCFAVTVFVLPELLSASLGIYNYLTDGIIGYVSAACVIAAYYYAGDGKRLAAVLISAVAQLTILKTSGRIFAAVVTVLVLCLFCKKLVHPKKSLAEDKRGFISQICTVSSLIVFQFLIPYLWQIYTKLTFPAHVDKFPSSASGVISAVGGRDAEYIKNILSMMAKELFDFTSTTVIFTTLTWVFAMSVIAMTLILRKKPAFIIGAASFCLVCQVIYTAELFVLYAFIFPPEEATILASFYRYYTTGALFTVIPLVTASTCQLQDICEKASIPRKRFIAFVAALFCATGMFVVRENIILAVRPTYKEDAAVLAEKRVSFADFYEEVSSYIPRDSYVLIYSDDTAFFHRNVVRLELLTSHYAFMSPADAENESALEEQLALRKYIVVHAGDTSALISSCEALGYKIVGEGTVYVIDNDTKTVIAAEK